jgi:DNA topoisomerase-1
MSEAKLSRKNLRVVPPVPPATQAAVAHARAAGLHYTTDGRPGIRRIRQGRSFRYIGPHGKRVTSAEDLARIRSLVIPPAWEDVWICPDPLGHLQATGRDVRGRKQYRYHPKWRVVRDETKFDRMIGFAQALPQIRETADRDTRREGMPREKVLATVVRLLEKTLIRVGNDEYAKQNGSFGLTTLRDGHVDVRGGRVRFTFRGKSGIQHAVDLDDRRLARIVKACRDIPGYDLFQYVDDDGKRQVVGSADVNAYLKEVGGDDFTSKDFRTWAATVLAAEFLRARQAEHREGRCSRRAPPGEHEGGLAEVLHPPDRLRCLCGRPDDAYARRQAREPLDARALGVRSRRARAAQEDQREGTEAKSRVISGPLWRYLRSFPRSRCAGRRHSDRQSGDDGWIRRESGCRGPQWQCRRCSRAR